VELQQGSKTELYQIMLARYYSSSLARFMAVDPGDDTAPEDPQSWNKYVYVRDNPLVRIDPDGKRENIGPLQYRPPSAQTFKAIGTVAKVVSKGAKAAETGAVLAAGANAVVGDVPGALGALGAAATAVVVKAGADLTAVATDFSEENVKEVVIDAIEIASAGVLGAVAKAGAPKASSVIVEGAKALIPTAAVAAGTAIAGQMESGPSAGNSSNSNRPLEITTPNGPAGPAPPPPGSIITKKER
jgi:RHS repeat-associated protein